jgi:hypothetical protein
VLKDALTNVARNTDIDGIFETQTREIFGAINTERHVSRESMFYNTEVYFLQHQS